MDIVAVGYPEASVFTVPFITAVHCCLLLPQWIYTRGWEYANCKNIRTKRTQGGDS